MGKPAARVLDMTSHGGMITGPGCPTVLIGKMPAARVTDMHVCPMLNGTVPHVGGPIIGPVPPTVLIGKLPAACVGDMCICTGPPSTILPPGCPTVLIGSSGSVSPGGKGAGAGASAPQSAPATGKSAADVETGRGKSVEVKHGKAEKTRYRVPESIRFDAGEWEERGQRKDAAGVTAPPARRFTLADIVEILEEIEAEEGYEAARAFAAHLDYLAVTELARKFVNGTDPDGNDPNQMPTRFMLLYGMDDAKLQCMDDHPDRFEGQEHKINVTNLRKALRMMGYTVAESGPYDDEVLQAHLHYMGLAARSISVGAMKELYEATAADRNTGKTETGVLRIRLEIDPALPEAQDDVYTLFSTDASRTYRQSKTVRDDAKVANNTCELVFAGLDKNLEYTLEVNQGATGRKKVLFRDRPYGRW